MAGHSCALCGVTDGTPRQLLDGQHVCSACYASSTRNGHLMAALACPKCATRYSVGARCPRCLVAERVGADVFECDCGARVEMADSVRMMRKTSQRIERVCLACSRRPTCLATEHHVVTATHRDWDPARFEFTPLPEGLVVSYCAVCGLNQYWDGNRWSRMTWPQLAEAWERAGA